jgi:hypothetical protein
MLHNMVTGPQFDGRVIGRYTQQWVLPGAALGNWERMGYDQGSDTGGEQWRNVYWHLGQNLIDMMRKAEAEQRWDLLGVGQVLKAWGWLAVTELHGEVIIEEAFDPAKFSFNYDTQEEAYQESFRLLEEAIKNLQRTDGAVDAAYLAKGDRIYNGDRTKWLKFAYGLRARARNHFTNKASYRPADVIADVDRALASNADDALLQYTSVGTEDANFYGWSRNNIRSFRQTRFVVGLMDGTVFGAVDPRMSRMLAAAPDGQYRGLDINVVGFGTLPAAQQPNNFFGYAGTGGGVGLPSRYIFDDRSKFPSMTYSQLQFVKAEAAFRAGDKATALAAYRNGVSSHIDFVNARNLDANQQATQITATEKAAFLADTRVVPTSPNALTLTQIMTQKYIAQWGWGHNELWTDMRRYSYTDVDPATGQQVYPGFAIPTNLFADNAGKIVWRLRPRFNSEYVWNRAGLDAIGALAADWHTKPTWIFQR